MSLASTCRFYLRTCAWNAHERAGRVHGNVLFNLVGYYERLGYPFRGWTMILLQFRLY